ncbi:MAG: hypothetical protein L0H53_15250, partial [Candidatus Nitrosocosmicus sp.]|nr:hypothetical protein [Candidatus Nitrosocosmicus sp.]
NRKEIIVSAPRPYFLLALAGVHHSIIERKECKKRRKGVGNKGRKEMKGSRNGNQYLYYSTSL